MAALAIDVVTLYVARSEMQRAADAAALAGAKALWTPGVTSDPSNANAAELWRKPWRQRHQFDILAQNKVSGAAPALVGDAHDSTSRARAIRRSTVTLQRTDLPTFFARIWGARLATVSATAVAEAYNASNSQTVTGNYPPIAPKCVKPLLVANQDPQTTLKFVDPASGAAVATGVVGEQITLYPACTGTGGVGTCTTIAPNPPTANSPAPKNLAYIPAKVAPNANNLCPACQGVRDLEQSIECCDFNPYSCGAAAVKIFTDTATRHGQLRTETNNGVQCLISNTPETRSIRPAFPVFLPALNLSESQRVADHIPELWSRPAIPSQIFQLLIRLFLFRQHPEHRRSRSSDFCRCLSITRLP